MRAGSRRVRRGSAQRDIGAAAHLEDIEQGERVLPVCGLHIGVSDVLRVEDAALQRITASFKKWQHRRKLDRTSVQDGERAVLREVIALGTLLGERILDARRPLHAPT